jgi:hypothetical protein
MCGRERGGHPLCVDGDTRMWDGHTRVWDGAIMAFGVAATGTRGGSLLRGQPRAQVGQSRAVLCVGVIPVSGDGMHR